jgi:hypothetical protein
MSNRRAGSGRSEIGAAEHGRGPSRRKAEIVVWLVRGGEPGLGQPRAGCDGGGAGAVAGRVHGHRPS